MLKLKEIIVLLLLIIFAFSIYLPSAASEAGTYNASISTDIENLDGIEKITLNVRDADIRDILSAIAVAMGNNIVFTGQPVNVSLSVQDVSYDDALNYLLKTAGMEYIQSDGTIIVGTRDVLNQDFFYNMSLTRFTLKYIDSDIVSSQIDVLSIPVQKVTLDSNKNAIWVQGLPGDLTKVHELIALLDKPENAGKEDASDYMLTAVTLNHITAEQMNEVLKEIGMDGGLIMDSNPMTLWVYGSNGDIVKINEIKNKIDIVQNAINNNFNLVKKEMTYLTTGEIVEILEQLGVNVNIITFERSLQTLWLNGDEKSIAIALSVIDKFDVEENINDNVFYVHKLVNITAKEAEKRLQYLDLEGVKTYTFNFPELTKNILVFCPQDYKLFVMNHLNRLDAVTDMIKVPVDYSNVPGGKSRLEARRDLIESITGISASRFTISDNVARDNSYHYVMYLEETPENIQLVKDVIKLIDNPTAESSSETADSSD